MLNENHGVSVNRSAVSIRSLEHTGSAGVVTWEDGHESTYPLRWLRYECTCANCGTSDTGIRFVVLHELPPNLSISNCQLNTDGNLEIDWEPGETSFALFPNVASPAIACLQPHVPHVHTTQQLGEAKEPKISPASRLKITRTIHRGAVMPSKR